MTLFDSIIKPILLYTCEIWGHMKNNENISNMGKSVIERFHFKICKQVIGVNRKASNIATIAELGRYPLFIDIQTMVIKYLLRFKTIKKERLLFKAYQKEIQNINEKRNWIYNAKNILDKNGLSYIFVNHMNSSAVTKQNIKETSRRLNSRSKDIY